MEAGMWDVVAMLLFVAEAYHVMGHTAVLFRIRMLPRRDLVRIRTYFLLDGFTTFVVAFFVTGRLQWLVLVHLAQHLYYYFTWEKSSFAKRVVDWSSLDWLQSPRGGKMELDNILGTSFDILVHVSNMCVLCSYLTSVHVLFLMALAQATACFVLFNPRFAWSSPGALPPWVQRRISPLQFQ